jgi:hypothetical protein
MLPPADRDVEMMLQDPSLCVSNLKEFFITLVQYGPRNQQLLGRARLSFSHHLKDPQAFGPLGLGHVATSAFKSKTWLGESNFDCQSPARRPAGKDIPKADEH